MAIIVHSAGLLLLPSRASTMSQLLFPPTASQDHSQPTDNENSRQRSIHQAAPFFNSKSISLKFPSLISEILHLMSVCITLLQTMLSNCLNLFYTAFFQAGSLLLCTNLNASCTAGLPGVLQHQRHPQRR